MRCDKRLAVFAFILLMTCSARAIAITVEELATQFEEYKVRQAAEFEKIRGENAALKAENSKLKASVKETQQQVEDNTAAVETVSESYSDSAEVGKWFSRTTLGGYGELHYNNLSNKPGTIDNGRFEEVDFHRFVLFFGHEFTDRLRIFSELEVEHANEVELEQAYIEFDTTIESYGILDSSAVKAGVVLVPVGILNETHEPGTFYGVERNDVESIIIPTSWREASLQGNLNFLEGIRLDLAVMSGLDLPGSGSSAFRIRNGRQSVSKAVASDGAGLVRLKYTGVPGLEIAGTFQYQANMGQGQTTGLGSGQLYEAHGIYSHSIGPGAVTLKALYANWNIQGNKISAADGNVQYGWYVEPSYRFPIGFLGDLGFYGRYEKVKAWRIADRFQQWEGGFNWWPHEDIVVKFDYRSADNDVDPAYSYQGFDLGIGYQF